ncbi:HTH-type transcriptional regulatory protein GabR [mine drainage metagenome]|uniref:HTH-type transcriptional regulatory protein GabR n=1 Tax=mine drainage metagenome TaxID=410659 RepID=A0A1J5QTM8_9ZZZZ
MPRTTLPPLLLPALARQGPEPLQRQLYHALRAAILQRRLPEGGRLPSSRALAAQLGISRNTVLAAYGQLQAEGYVDSRPASGLTVAALEAGVAAAGEGAALRGERRCSRRAAALVTDAEAETAAALPLSPRGIDAALFPAREWSRLLARRWRRPGPALLDGNDPAGFAPLRRAIAEHLGRSRGVRCAADQVVVVSGSQQALDLAVRLLLDPGDQAWIEDPGYGGLKAALRAAGAVPLPVPVDGQGFDPRAAERAQPGARVAFITPSHQFPTGATMPVERRLALIEWAARSGGWIVEDDYDSDFRYNGPPLAALQGLDPNGRTLYCGTFSKSMFAGLRLGWLVAPPDLLAPVLALRAAADGAPPLLGQAAMADFMAEGLLQAHLRRLRAAYGERRAALLAAATRHLAGLAEISAGEAGTHILAWLPEGRDDQALARAARAKGLGPVPLSRYRLRPGRPGLILGYAAHPPAVLEAAAAALASVLRA